MFRRLCNNNYKFTIILTLASLVNSFINSSWIFVLPLPGQTDNNVPDKSVFELSLLLSDAAKFGFLGRGVDLILSRLTALSAANAHPLLDETTLLVRRPHDPISLNI